MSLVVWLFFPHPVSGDVVYLKSGKKIEGKIWKLDEARRVVIVSDTQRGLQAIPVLKEDIQSIQSEEGGQEIITQYIKSLYYYQEGGKSYKRVKYYRAMYFFKKAVELNPRSAQAHYNLGLTYHQLNLYREAIESFNKALELAQSWSEKSGKDLLFIDEIRRKIIKTKRRLKEW